MGERRDTGVGLHVDTTAHVYSFRSCEVKLPLASIHVKHYEAPAFPVHLSLFLSPFLSPHSIASPSPAVATLPLKSR